jgi:hypothetical protein
MSTNRPAIAGALPPRRSVPAATSLVRDNRPPAPEPEVEEQAPNQSVTEAREALPALTNPLVEDRTNFTTEERADADAREELAEAMRAQEAIDKAREKSVKRSVRRAGMSQLATEIPADLHSELRAAFRLAAYPEDLASFAEFLTKALRREVDRVAVGYNNGKPLKPIQDRLPGGRPTTK